MTFSVAFDVSHAVGFHNGLLGVRLMLTKLRKPSSHGCQVF